MKIYVDELPKSCDKCEFCDKDNGLCNILGQYFRDGYDYTDCPLQSLADHDKQVRKEVCEGIKNKIEQAKLIYEWKGKEITIEDILDQIQGETK
jgi:hypothetical protein